MFCSKCGKKIDYDALVCRECAAPQEATLAPEVKTAEPKVKSTRWLGLGGAITATLIGLASWVFVSVMVLGFVTGAVGLMISVGLVALALALSSVAGGLEAIKIWDATRREGKPAPVATSILSIASFANATAVLLFITVFTFIVI